MTCLSLGRLSLLSAALLLGACAVGPDYERPNTAVSAQFKEASGWKTAAPSDQQLGDA